MLITQKGASHNRAVPIKDLLDVEVGVGVCYLAVW
jgi:hypothetical protein